MNSIISEYIVKTADIFYFGFAKTLAALNQWYLA